MSELKVEDLENALMERAKALADEYITRAKRSRHHFIEDENERLRLHEDREVFAAKMLAERIYRSRIQGSELQKQKDMDQLRWSLAQAVLDGLKERLKQIVQIETQYLPILKQFIVNAAQVIEQPHLIAEFNHQDQQRLKSGWDEFVHQALPEKKIQISAQVCQCMGGVIVYSIDRKIRVDNSFEGRIERLQDDLCQVVVERLFSEVAHMGSLVHGR